MQQQNKTQIVNSQPNQSQPSIDFQQLKQTIDNMPSNLELENIQKLETKLQDHNMQQLPEKNETQQIVLNSLTENSKMNLAQDKKQVEIKVSQIQNKNQKTKLTDVQTNVKETCKHSSLQKGKESLEFVNKSNQSSHTISLLQRVISSNEDMLKQQANLLKIYRENIKQKQQSFQTLQKKHQILLQTLKKNKQNPTEVLLQRIVEVQKQLIQTKIELAIKSGEVLEYQYQLNDLKNKFNNSSKSLTLSKTYSDNSSQYQPQNQKQSPHKLITKNNISQQFQIGQVKYKDIFQQNRRKLSQQEENHLLIWKKQLQQFSSSIFSTFVNNIELTELLKFKEKSSHLLKKFVFIPHQLRLKIWPILTKNVLGISNSLYIELLDHQKKGWISQKVKNQIQKDMIRSFNGRGTMENLQKIKISDKQKNTFTTINTNRIAQDATQILEIFHIYRPDVGYVQGMTYPTIILTLVVGKITAFMILSNLLIGNQFFRKLITFEPNFIAIFCRTFDKIAETFYPTVSKHLKKHQISSQVYLVDWFFTFFSRGLSPKTILCIWDNIFYYQELAMYRLSLAIFQLLQQNILQNQYENCIRLIRQYYLNIDQKQLLSAFNNSKLTKQKFQKVYKMIKKSF